MDDVIVVAGATHRNWLQDELEQQLSTAKVPFHLETVAPMPSGPNSMTMSRKLQFVRSMAQQFAKYRAIYIVDAWDVLFYGTRQDLIDKAQDLMFSAERNSYPEVVAGYGETSWRYCNAGCMVGKPSILSDWADSAEREGDLEILDQAWLNRHLYTGFVPIDTTTNLFYVMSARLEDGDMQLRRSRPWNCRCDTYPNFIHFSGRCPDTGFRQMMEGK